MKLIRELKTGSENDLPAVCAEILSLAAPGILLFNAPMGAGKTTFIRHLCRLMGSVDEVSSPTYSLVNEYLTKKGEKIFHFDFYRIDNLQEAYDMGAEDYFESGKPCLIEWPDIVKPLIHSNYMELKIEPEGKHRRYLLFSSAL